MGLFRALLLLCATLGSVTAIRREELPYGVLTHKVGEVRVEMETFEVMFIRNHPKVFQARELSRLRRQTDTLLNTVMSVKPERFAVYRQRLVLLDASRNKRAINFVGDVLKWAFGTATVKDVDKIRRVVSKLSHNLNGQRVAIENTIAVVNELQVEVEMVEAKVNELVTALHDIESFITTITESQQRFSERLRHTEIAFVLESVISYLEVYTGEIEHFDRLFQYRRDLAVIGHLTESLVKRKDLKIILNRIGSDLSLDYLYANLEVRLMLLDTDKLGFWISIPKVGEESYTAWDIHTVPFFYKGAVRQLVPEVSQAGLGLTSGRIIERENCQYDNPTICETPIEFENLVCTEGILTQNRIEIGQCPMQEIIDERDRVVRVSLNAIILYSHGEAITERCRDKPANSIHIERGTHVIEADAGCVIASDAGWTFRFLLQNRQVMNVTDTFTIILPDLEFDVPDKTEPLTFNVSTIEELIVRRHHKLPPITRSHDMQVLHTGGSTFGFLSFLISCGLLAAVAVFLYKRYRRRVVLTKPVVQPTMVNDPADKPSVTMNLYPQLEGSNPGQISLS